MPMQPEAAAPDRQPTTVAMGHAGIEADLHAGLFSDTLPGDVISPAGDDIARRFAVYRNNVRHGLTEALRRRFLVIERIVGPAFFGAMAGPFIAAHPPATPVLLAWGEALPDFLDGFPPVAGLPYLGDVARLELARGRAYHAADAVPADPGQLACADPGSLRLGLHPSVTLLASRHPILSIWGANQPDAAPGGLRLDASEQVMVARTADPAATHPVVVVALDPATHAVLAHLQAGRSLAEAAQAGDPTQALALLLRDGLIIHISTGELP